MDNVRLSQKMYKVTLEKITSSNYQKAKKLSKTLRIVLKDLKGQLEEAPTGQGRAIRASVSIVPATDRNISSD